MDGKRTLRFFCQFSHTLRKGMQLCNCEFFSAVLAMVFICAAGSLFPSTLNAEVIQWWSADLQPSNASTAGYTGSAGDMWNVLTVPV